MSVVTTIMLHLNSLESDDPGDPDSGHGYGVSISTINAWLTGAFEGNHPWWDLQPLHNAPTGYWGGSKAPQVALFAGAFNVFELAEEDFLAYIATLPWEFPADVQVFISREGDQRFAIYMLNQDRTWRELCDGNTG